MSDSKELAELIRRIVLKELAPAAAPPAAAAPAASRTPPDLAVSPEDLALAKKTAAWLGSELPGLPWFGNWRAKGDRSFYLGRTPARLGVGRAGCRYRTETILSFLADHAAARDAVHSALDGAMLAGLGALRIISAAPDKEQFLARPELGRRLSDEGAELVRKGAAKGPQVQIVAGDGLSATAINVNLPLLLPPLEAALRAAGVRLGSLVAIDNGRVAAGDHVARLADAELLCMLVGERPGLKTAESMGAYVTCMKVTGFNEAMRSVVSNIHAGGLAPAGEGATQVANLCLRALREKRTGVGLSA